MRTALFLALLLLGASCSKTVGPCTGDSSCTAGLKCCAGTCVDVSNTTTHCGSCALSCGTAHASARCVDGICALSCTSGFGDCDGANKNGCETPLTNASDNCGTCGKVCSYDNANAVCDKSLCQQSTCLNGYGDCNLATND